jgi:uncharacterized protein (DUF433 family)
VRRDVRKKTQKAQKRKSVLFASRSLAFFAVDEDALEFLTAKGDTGGGGWRAEAGRRRAGGWRTEDYLLAWHGKRDILPLMDRIEINPAVCNGKPVIRNTRVTVQTVLSYLSAGDSVDEVLAAHPRLERADVLACLAYARRLSELHSTVALAS